jgi:hypothetical protein
VVSAILAAASGVVGYLFAQRRKAFLASLGLVGAFLASSFVIALTQEATFGMSPIAIGAGVRIGYILVFVCLGLVVGVGLGA